MTLVSGSLKAVGEKPAGGAHRRTDGRTDGQTPVQAGAVTLPSNGHRPRVQPGDTGSILCSVWVTGGGDTHTRPGGAPMAPT